MSEHTPGPLDPPWVVMESDDAFEIHAAGGEGFIVAFVAKPGGPFDAEMPKAVKLIAAAPLLVEACEAWVKFYKGDIPVPDGEPADDAVLAAWNECERKIEEAMRAALAAAGVGE